MSFISNILTKYDYIYFDSRNQPQIKQLNIFQCFFRKAFGYYSDTHLTNVVKKAYRVTLNDEFQTTSKKQEALLKLIVKSERMLSRNTFQDLHTCKLPKGRELNIGVHYNIKSTGGVYRISSIDFQLTFDKSKPTEKIQEISIFKNKSERAVVHFRPNFLVEGDRNDSETLIKQRFTSETTTTISDLIAKILNDSIAASGIAEFHCYANDYRWIPGFTSRDMFASYQTPEALNGFQEKAMKQVGWEYLNQFAIKSKGLGLIEDVKRVYIFRKEVASTNRQLVSLGFNQQVSLAFASRILEAQDERDY